MKKNKRFCMMLIAGALVTAGLMGCTVKGGDSGPGKNAAAGTVNSTELERAESEKSADGVPASEKNDNWFSDLDTVDIEGNQVSGDFFADYDITLINTWATFCGPCIREMPELEELYQEYQGKNIGIAGLVVDSSTVEVIAGLTDDERTLAEEILSQTGATYPQLTVSEALAQSDFKRIAQYPTTFFVDKNGNFVGEAISGARSKEEWEKIIEEYLLLAGKQPAQAEQPEQQEQKQPEQQEQPQPDQQKQPQPDQPQQKQSQPEQPQSRE